MKIYAIPGMGADGRVFHKIKFPTAYELILVEWIPAKPEETLEDYSLRLLSIIDTSQPFALMGLSMGGMIACSYTHHYKPAFIILISSVASYQDLPPYYYWLGKTQIQQIIPMSMLKILSKWKRRILKESSEDKELLLDMIQKSDPDFLRWSIQAILNWKQIKPSTTIYHIHGLEDWLIPKRFIKSQPIYISGGHAMILSSATEIQIQLDQIFKFISTN